MIFSKNYFSKIFFLISLFTFVHTSISNVYITPDNSEVIQHKIVKEISSDEDFVVEALINFPKDSIDNITLFYKSKNQINYFKIDMDYKGYNFYETTISKNFLTTESIQYYILLELHTDKIYSFPYESPTLNPINANIIKKNKNKKKILKNEKFDVEIISPLPNTKINSQDIMISLSYFKLKNIDRKNIKVYLDNREITNKVTFYDNFLIYKPPYLLDGKHKIEIVFKDKFNQMLPSVKWNFIIFSEDKIKGLSSMFDHSGNIGGNYSFNDVSDEEFNIYKTNIDYRVNLDFLKIRTKLKSTSLSTEYEQDRNRYLLDVKMPFIQLQLGDSYPYFNQYALNGYRIRGLNLKIDSKYIDFNLIQGELQRTVTGAPSENSILISDVEETINIGNGIWDDAEDFVDDNGNGIWDDGEDFVDDNGNGIWDDGEDFVDENDNGVWDDAEEFEDTDGDGLWDDAEEFEDTDEDGEYTDGEPFTDENGNGVWDDAEELDDANILPSDYILNISRDNYDFKRNVYGLNIGFGNPETYFFNFNILKAKDNIRSVSQIENDNMLSYYIVEIPDEIIESIDPIFLAEGISSDQINVTEINDSTNVYSTSYDYFIDNFSLMFDDTYSYNILTENWLGDKPKDNLVVSSNFKLMLDDQRIIFDAGASFSLLNQNIWDPVLSLDDLDLLLDDDEDGLIMGTIDIPSDIDFSQYEDIFHIGLNQVPLLPIDISDGTIEISDILMMPSLAYNMDLSLKYLDHNITMGLKQIGPEYNSLANLFLQKDVREQYIVDRFRLFDNKIFMNLGFKRLEDGISLDYQTLSRTDRYDFLINYYPGSSLPTYNLSVRINDRDNAIDDIDIIEYPGQYLGPDLCEDDDAEEPLCDSEYYEIIRIVSDRRENTYSTQFSFGLSYNFRNIASHNLIFNVSQLKKDDLFEKEMIEVDPSYYSSRLLNQSLIFNIKSIWSSTLKTNINYNFNYYDYGTKNTEYFQYQYFNELGFKISYLPFQKLNKIELGISFSNTAGYLEYNQISTKVVAIFEPFKNIYFDISYENRYRDSDYGNNQYLFSKLTY